MSVLLAGTNVCLVRSSLLVDYSNAGLPGVFLCGIQFAIGLSPLWSEPMKPSRFLIVDSDRDAAETIARTFAGVGYRYDIVGTAAAAQTRIDEEDFSTVIVAEHLVDGDGIDCFLRLRRQSHRLTGLLMADQCDVATVFSAIRFGIEHVMQKPIDMKQLLGIVSATSQPREEDQQASA